MLKIKEFSGHNPGPKACDHILKWLEGYDKIIINMSNDTMNFKDITIEKNPYSRHIYAYIKSKGGSMHLSVFCENHDINRIELINGYHEVEIKKKIDKDVDISQLSPVEIKLMTSKRVYVDSNGVEEKIDISPDPIDDIEF